MRHEIARGRPLIRAELVKNGLRGNTLSEMAARGAVYRVAQGIYIPAEGSTSEYFDYETAAQVVRKGVFTLQSALRIYDLTDENPTRMILAIPLKAHLPKTTLPIDVVYMKPELLARDVEEILSNGTTLRVFSLERTLVECFKARNKIGINLCVAALNEAIEKRNPDPSRLWDAMNYCRMTRVMGPYLEGRI